MPRKTGRTFAVIGLGNFGSTVATELARFGNYVIGIDRDEAAASRLADKIGQAVIVDGKDEVALRDVGLAECDAALVAMGEGLESSVLTVMNLRLIGVGQIWAKAVSRTHHRILSKLGVDRVVHPEEEIGRHMAQVLNNPMVRDYVSLGNGFHIVNLRVPQGLAGRTLADLDLGRKFDLRAIGLMRGSDWLGGPETGSELATDDKLLLLGNRSNLRAFADSI